MPYQIPINQPLTKTQAELTAKIGAMKNLLSLDTFKKVFNIPKGEHMSVRDYLLRVLKAMGLSPDVIYKTFINKFLDTDFLTDLLIKATSQLLAANGKNISNGQNTENPTSDQKKSIKTANYNYINNSPIIKPALRAAVDVFKQQLVKNLTTLLFGKPKDAAAQLVMHPVPSMLDDLVGEAACGSMIFSVSSPATLRNQDLEYNKVQMATRLANNQPQINITCAGVSVVFPANPAYIFGQDVLTGIPSTNITPAESVDLIINLVANQVQQQNQETNAPTAAAAFRETMVENIISNIMVLLRPLFSGFKYIEPGYDGIIKVLRETTGDPTITDDYVSPTNCQLLQQYGMNPINTSDPKNKNTQLVTILCNMLLNYLISFILPYLINKLKKFVLNYFAKKAAEKAALKAQKIKEKFALTEGESATLQQAKMAAKLGQEILPLISPDDNSSNYA